MILLICVRNKTDEHRGREGNIKEDQNRDGERAAELVLGPSCGGRFGPASPAHGPGAVSAKVPPAVAASGQAAARSHGAGGTVVAGTSSASIQGAEVAFLQRPVRPLNCVSAGSLLT